MVKSFDWLTCLCWRSLWGDTLRDFVRYWLACRRRTILQTLLYFYLDLSLQSSEHVPNLFLISHLSKFNPWVNLKELTFSYLEIYKELIKLDSLIPEKIIFKILHQVSSFLKKIFPLNVYDLLNKRTNFYQKPIGQVHVSYFHNS